MRTLPFLLLSLCFPLHGVRAGITVAAAISMADAVEEISAAYETETGKGIRHTFSGTNVLARQIEEGAPIDVFVSADTATMDGLVAKRLVEKGSVLLIATNELVVVVLPQSGISVESSRDLLAVDRIAIADPDSVPAGIYARNWLTAEKVWKSIGHKAIRVRNVRAALIAAESGNAGAAIVYRSDAVFSKKVNIALVADSAKTGSIEYAAGVVSGSKRRAEAESFVEFLKGETAVEIFIKHGFGKP